MGKTLLLAVISGTMNWDVWDRNLTEKEMKKILQKHLKRVFSH